MFIAVLFTVGKYWEEPRDPTIENLLCKSCSVLTRGFYTVIGRMFMKTY